MRRLVVAGLTSAAFLIAGIAAPAAASPLEMNIHYTDDSGCTFVWLWTSDPLEYCWQASGSLMSKIDKDGNQTFFKKFRTEHHTLTDDQGVVLRDCIVTELYISSNGVTRVDTYDQECVIQLL